MLHTGSASAIAVRHCVRFGAAGPRRPWLARGPRCASFVECGGRIGSLVGVRLSSFRGSKLARFGLCNARGARPRAAAVETEKKGDAKGAEGAKEDIVSSFKCLAKVQTRFNRVVILEGAETAPSQFAGCRVLLLDNSGNVHSVYRPDTAWTGSYWDEFSSLPAILPVGPVAIFGLAAGTAARLMLEVWPALRLEGYEIDGLLVNEARRHLGLSNLEKPTLRGGYLKVHVQDALSPSAIVEGKFAGIIVDIFSDGAIPLELQQPHIWRELQTRLRAGGRIMVNCGGICVEKGDPKTEVDDGTWTWEDGGSSKIATLRAMAAAFQGQLSWRTLELEEADNCFALTGPLPDLEYWASGVPERLKDGVSLWKPYI